MSKVVVSRIVALLDNASRLLTRAEDDIARAGDIAFDVKAGLIQPETVDQTDQGRYSYRLLSAELHFATSGIMCR